LLIQAVGEIYKCRAIVLSQGVSEHENWWDQNKADEKDLLRDRRRGIRPAR
jgi:hypothetical protein